MKRGEWRISTRSFISIRWVNRIPRLILHEKYEKTIKWFLRSLALIGIISSVIVFNTWYYSLSVSLIILIIERFFENVIFQYSTLYVHPFPSSDVGAAKWNGFGFAFRTDFSHESFNLIGPSFPDEKTALKFQALMLEWNFNQDEDPENNICISFILESETSYSVYIYPSLTRHTAQEFFKLQRDNLEPKHHGKELQELHMTLMFCKELPYSKESKINLFTAVVEDNEPFLFCPFIMENSGRMKIVDFLKPIKKFHYKFKRREDLSLHDLEYDHGRLVMKRR